MTEARFNAYYLALAEESDAMEWAAFTRVAAKRSGWKFIPSLPELLDALRVFRGGPPLLELQGEASDAYERVISASTYTAEGGASWNYRTVAERCGKAAADAFLAAGGHHAFATTWDEAKRRERFIAAYQETAREIPDARLLPPGDAPKQIEAAPEPTAVEARDVLKRISGAVKVEPIQARRLTEAEREERLRRLREQAELLVTRGAEAPIESEV